MGTLLKEFQGHKQQVLQHTEQRVRQLKLKKKSQIIACICHRAWKHHPPSISCTSTNAAGLKGIVEAQSKQSVCGLAICAVIQSP